MDLAYKHESNEMNLISIIIHTYIVFTGIQIEKAVRIKELCDSIDDFWMMLYAKNQRDYASGLGNYVT